ncbi:MAG TPA: hypothetical protein VEA37_08395, partial [Flavobacterium sp.]|nr:hypothetical protein [Flavobacterium sp.]
MRSYIFDRLSFFSLFLVIILLPVFFLPFTNIPVETSKGLLLVLGVSLSLIFWGFGRFFDGKIVIPKSYLLLGGLGIVVASFLSAAFAKAPEVSFFGAMLDIGTFWFMLAGFLLMIMSAITLREPGNARIALLGGILSSTIVLVFQSLRFFFPAALSLGVLSDKTQNLVGSWNAFGIFAGFSV